MYYFAKIHKNIDVRKINFAGWGKCCIFAVGFEGKISRPKVKD